MILLQLFLAQLDCYFIMINVNSMIDNSAILGPHQVKLSSGQTVDLIPWCLPNTAKRHNQWKGLFGRLDWEGNFPTSITDPQPMGKVGMCFHPEQDRIITVRECARSQVRSSSYLVAYNLIDMTLK